MTPELKTWLTEKRHELQLVPEVSGHERGTAASIANLLQACGSDAVLTGIGGHGMAAIYDPKFSSWSLIPASFGRYFHVISVRLRPIVRPKRITQWVSRFQVFRMLLPLRHQQVNLKGLSILFRFHPFLVVMSFFLTTLCVNIELAEQNG